MKPKIIAAMIVIAILSGLPRLRHYLASAFAFCKQAGFVQSSFRQSFQDAAIVPRFLRLTD